MAAETPHVAIIRFLNIESVLGVFHPNNPDEHQKHVELVLKRLRKFKLYCKLEKCHFFVKSIPYLGYIISPNGVTMDPAKVEAIKSWPSPQNMHDVQVFLGFANFYRRFIHKYSALTQPWTKLLRKNQPFAWTPETESSFQKIKQSFTTAPILIHPDNSKPFVVETDASDFALGAVLSQYDAGNELKPVAFYSRQLLPAERNYEIYDKELLAIIDAFKEWRHFLQGGLHAVTILCDHKNLQYFMTTRQLSRRQARWSLFLSEFNFVLTYRPGSRNGKADLLSRRSDYLPRRERWNH